MENVSLSLDFTPDSKESVIAFARAKLRSHFPGYTVLSKIYFTDV
jgi:hypothetical protein